MYTNNYYYKLICETLIGEEIEGHHPDIYYLELILGTYSVTYETVKCKGKYLKDWYIALTGATVTSSHPNVYYLRLIANYLTSQTLPWRTENYYLKLISENIEPTITVQLSASATTLTVGNSTTLTVTVLDESSDPIEDASVTIYNGETSITTDTTDENGQIEYSYTPSSVGTFELSAVYDTTTSNIVSLTVNKITPSLSITTNDNTINVGDAPSMSGVLSTEESGKSIKIYKDSSQTALATVTTSTGGAWSYTDSATTNSGTISYYAVYEGDDTYESVTSSLLNIAVYKINTTLNITPPTILLDEEFDVVGNLSDANSTAISGATVTLNWTVGGVNHSATSTTDSNGDVTFHSSAPTTITTYTFQLSYAGSNKYLNSQSSQIEVNVSDTSTNLTVSNPINDTRVTPTDTVNVNGYLEDTNGNRLSNKTIKVKLSSTVLATTTTDSNGAYTTSFNASSLSDGSNTVTITFEGDTGYNSSTVTRTVIKGVYQITLSEANNKTILSYADSDTASLQATLTHGGVAVPNQLVTIFDSGMDTYNSNTTLDEDWSSGFKVRFVGGSQSYVVIGSMSSTNYIMYAPYSGAVSNVIISKGGYMDAFNCGEWLEYKNGVLYGSNGNTFDVSSHNIDFTKNSITRSGTLYRGVIDVATTDNTGKATVTYTSQGVGDIGFKAEWSTFVSESFGVQDCWRYDLATSDKTSSYGSPITYRGSHSGTWNYNSSNGYYGTITDQDEVMIPFTELTGKDDFTIEFDAQFTNNTSNQKGLAGICAYEDNNNYSRISCHALKTAQRIVVSGTANESETDVLTTVSVNDVLHFKFTVHNNQIIGEVTKGTTSVGTRTISYTPTNNTKYGFSLVWLNIWASQTFLKNIKIKPLPPSIELSASSDIISYADLESTTLTATHSQGTGKTVALYKQLGSTPNPSADTLVGTMTDNQDGTYSYTYTSIGAGDTSFYATDGMLVSETFTIQDWWFYDSQTSNKSRYSTSSGNITYNSDGCSVVGTDNNNCAIVENTALTLPNSDYSLECTIGDYTTTTSGSTTYKGGLIIDNSFIDVEGSRVVVYQLNPISVKQVISSKTFNVGDIVKIVKESGSLKYYLNDTLLTTQTISSTGKFGYRSCVNRGLRIKDLKVKPL